MSDLISREAVENITWEEPSYSDPLNVLTEVRDKVRELPSADIMECARAIQKHCDMNKCKSCEFGREMFTGHINCALFIAKPYDWDLPDGEKGIPLDNNSESDKNNC